MQTESTWLSVSREQVGAVLHKTGGEKMGKGARERGLGAEEEEQINIDPGVLQHVLRLTISFFFFFFLLLPRTVGQFARRGRMAHSIFIYL